MSFDLNIEKFGEAVLFLLANCEGGPGLTRLIKLLAYADFKHYAYHLHPLTGVRYVALERGPAPDGYREIFETLENTGLVERRVRHLQGYGQPKVEFRPLRQPNLAVFSETESDLLRQTVEVNRYKATAELIDEHHGAEGPWAACGGVEHIGQPIPWGAVRWTKNLPDEDDEVAKSVALKSLQEVDTDIGQRGDVDGCSCVMC